MRTAIVLLLVACACMAAGSDAARLRQKLFGSPALTPLTDRVSTSDPANTPLSVAAFLQGEEAPLVQPWTSALEDAPMTREVDQEVLIPSQQMLHQAQQQQQAAEEDSALLEQQQQWVQEGHHASEYEPRAWPQPGITPDPYQHLTHRHGGGTNEHNNIGGALGVQSAAVPWDYRHYSGNLNSHRKAEPLIYTPLVIAKDHDGKSAIDLTSIVNRQYQSQRMSSNPQYANTLSALTDYKPIQLHPTDHWLPQMPVQAAPGVRNPKYWEQHFLDLYAPTPPPLLAPVPPRMKSKSQGSKRVSLLETQAVELPSILRGGERVKPLVTPVLDAQNQPVAFHDQAAEADAVRRAREVDVFAPAHADEWQQEAAFLEMDAEIEAEDEMEDHEAFEMELMQEEEDGEF